ncbi:AMP-binding protein [Catenulispora sp. NL8]|uniref:AMP-binding protein n=1 Tax=Catenulispora pinistramenti TaxID=2705254 RepID=A0ABS5KRN5_9ACTN|nr:AMP-binding protein [Catenulispora pinistramenti]MBS2548718.1 AMP-binding protein [Catenulispora pinistramenti]
MTGRWNTSVAELLIARAGDQATALMWVVDDGHGGDGTVQRISWDEHVQRSAARAAWLAERLPAAGEGPRHVGVLMENVPEFSFLLGAAALGRFTLVGLNPTRGAAEVVRDARHTDCALIVTETRFLDMVGDCGVPVVDIDAAENWIGAPRKGFSACLELQDEGWDRSRDEDSDDGRDEDREDGRDEDRAEDREDISELPFMLILTSGTTSAPKAVVCTQGKLASQGSTLARQRGLTDADVLYCAMPLFHSNAVIASWIPAVATGATLALRRRFSASGFLPDVRRFGATYANYVGKPLAYILATPEQPDDAANPLRQVFGNEAAPADVERFGKRFGCLVTEAFGSTEGGISFYRLPSTPAGALGVPVGDVRIVDPDSGAQCPVGEVGEMVNFAGAGAFEGYYKHHEADAAKLRDGRFWSGDLGYRDADGNFFFAGRSADWIRVGGENFASGPIARAVEEWQGAVAAAAYGVPDVAAGDQVMVAVELTDEFVEKFDPIAFGAYLGSRSDFVKLWWPRYVRLVASMPRTATNKVVVRGLVEQAWYTADPVFVRTPSGYRPMTGDDRAELAREFARHGRRPPRGW